MFSILYWKDIRDHLMTFRFGAILVTTLLLISASFWVLSEDYLRRMDAYNRNADTYAQEAMDVYVPSQIIPELHMAPSSLSVFSQGETRNLGNSISITRWSVPSKATGSLTDNMLLVAYQPFDLLTIITLVMSIFGILLAYDSVSGEKEHGTLKLAISYSVPRGTYFSAKFFANVTILSLPFLIALIISFIMISFTDNMQFSTAEWVSISLMILISLVYSAVFIAVGMMCSALMRRSSLSLISSLLIWAFSVLLLPNFGNAIATSLMPLPSQFELTNFRSETNDEIRENRPDFSEGMENISMWGSAGGEQPWLLDGNPNAFTYLTRFFEYYESRRREQADNIWRLIQGHNEAKKGQNDLSYTIAFLAPATHLRQAFTSLSGTDFRTYERFIDNAQRFRRELLRTFDDKGFFTDRVWAFVSRLPRHEITDEGWRTRLAQYRAARQRGEEISFSVLYDPLAGDLVPPMPDIEYDPNLNAVLVSLAVLTIMVLILFLTGFTAFLRYDPR